MLAVLKREFNSLWHNMTAQIFSAVLIAIVGIYFIAYNVNYGYPFFSVALYSTTFILLIIVPLLTMRSFSEERKQKTDQILLTSPLRLSDIVLGKFFAMCLVLLLVMVILCLCPLIIRTLGTAYLAADYATIFAYFVVGCFYISVGMFISSLTESQVISAVCTIAALFVVYLWDGILSLLPTSASGTILILLLVLAILCVIYHAITKNWLASIGIWLAGAIVLLVFYFTNSKAFANFFTTYLSGFSVTATFENFAIKTIFDLAGIIKTLIATAVMLFLTAQTIQKRRWN